MKLLVNPNLILHIQDVANDGHESCQKVQCNGIILQLYIWCTNRVSNSLYSYDISNPSRLADLK